METKIISQKSNPFLEREEFVMEIVSDLTPTDAQIKEELGKDNDLTVIRKLTTKFGTKNVVADIIVYDNVEAKKKNQVLPQKLRKKLEAEEKAHLEEEKKAKVEAEKAEAEKVVEEEKVPEEEEKKEETKEETVFEEKNEEVEKKVTEKEKVVEEDVSETEDKEKGEEK